MDSSANALLLDELEKHLQLGEGPPFRGSMLPRRLLLGLRAALESGLSCEQITCILTVAAGLHEMSDRFDEGELVKRVQHLVKVMKGDVR